MIRTPTVVLSNGITLPYYRFYRQNTLLPILSIAKDLENREKAEVVATRLQQWRERKLQEYQLVQVAVCPLVSR